MIIEPFGKAFVYGVEACRRRRYSSACIQFATAFEVFQKHFVEILLKREGVQQLLARFLVYDLDLPRKNYSQVAQHILHKANKTPRCICSDFCGSLRTHAKETASD
jgi:transcriptional regulator NrdR family protein